MFKINFKLFIQSQLRIRYTVRNMLKPVASVYNFDMFSNSLSKLWSRVFKFPQMLQWR